MFPFVTILPVGKVVIPGSHSVRLQVPGDSSV